MDSVLHIKCVRLVGRVYEALETFHLRALFASKCTDIVTCSGLLLTQGGEEPLLPEQAELHLLEAIGLITSAAAAGEPSGTSEVDPAYQLTMLEEILSTIVQQLQQLLSSQEDLSRYGLQFAEFAAWKFGSIAALIRGHTPKTHGGLSADLFLKATLSVVPVLVEFGKYKLSRSKGIVLLHRIVTSVGGRVVEPAGDCLPVFIQWAEASDIEFPLQLINQLILEFGSESHERHDDVLVMVNGMLQGILDKLSSLYAELQVAEEAAKARVVGGVEEGDEIIDTSLEAEKAAIQKQYLTFLQHVACHGCHSAFLSDCNMQRLPDILTNIASGLRGGDDDGISNAVGLTLRRPAVTLLSCLTTSWIQEDSSVHPDVENLLLSFLCEQALPITIGACSEGSLNVVDPQTQSFIGDVGVMLWSLASVRRQDTQKYLQEDLLPNLGWHDAAIAELMSLFRDFGPVNIFRDKFKKLIRKLHSK